MEVEGRIIKLDDLVKISKLLSDNGYADVDMEICINVPSDKLLNKINEDLYYRNKTEDKPSFVENVDEINLVVNNIKFRYIKKV